MDNRLFNISVLLNDIEWQLTKLEYYFHDEALRAVWLNELQEASRKIYFASKLLENTCRKIMDKLENG